MKTFQLGFFGKLKLKLFGKKYYQAHLLPLMALNRYGYEEYFSEAQIRQSAIALGHPEYFDEKQAMALLAKPEESPSSEEYLSIRKKFGLYKDGALEVLRVYGKREKHPSDPFGSNQAAETTGGMD